MYIGTGSKFPFSGVLADLLLKIKRAPIKQQMPMTPNATPIPIPAFAPMLSSDVDAELEGEDVPEFVELAEEPVGDVEVLDDPVATASTKIYPLTYTPYRLYPAAPMVIVVVVYPTPAVVRGVMTCPLVKFFRHCVADGADIIVPWKSYPSEIGSQSLS